MLDQAKDRQFSKYKEVLKSSSSNNNPWGWGWGGGGTTYFAAYQVSSYAEEITTVKNWFRQRLQFLDENLPGEDSSTAICAPTYYDVDLQLCGCLLSIHSPKAIHRIDVVNAIGQPLLSHPIPNRSKAAINLMGFGHGLFVVVIYANDGSMVSRSVRL